MLNKILLISFGFLLGFEVGLIFWDWKWERYFKEVDKGFIELLAEHIGREMKMKIKLERLEGNLKYPESSEEVKNEKS
jgi:hypothetical protein